MRIITVNLPLSYLRAIDSLTGDGGLYPSRSELIRVAVRDFLIRELKAAESFTTFQSQRRPKPTKPDMDEPEGMVVRVPLSEGDGGDVEYKTYRLVKRQ